MVAGSISLYYDYHYYYYYYYYSTGQSALASTPQVKNWRTLLEQSFTARMPLLTATSTLGLGRRH